MSLYDESKTRPVLTIQHDLGAAAEAFRLSRNLKQADIARQAGISTRTLQRLEAGQGGTVETLIRVLRALGVAEGLDNLIPDATLSPLDPVSGHRKKRRRARPTTAAETPRGWQWND